LPDTFTPPKEAEPTASPATALAVLKERLDVDFTAPYHDPADPRHELAVLAVDLGRRLVDVHQWLRDRCEQDRAVLDALAVRARARDDLTRYVPFTTPVAPSYRPEALAARAEEISRTLRLVVGAYRSAWCGLPGDDAAPPVGAAAHN
jgi:hypothetical protein